MNVRRFTNCPGGSAKIGDGGATVVQFDEEKRGKRVGMCGVESREEGRRLSRQKEVPPRIRVRCCCLLRWSRCEWVRKCKRRAIVENRAATTAALLAGIVLL